MPQSAVQRAAAFGRLCDGESRSAAGPREVTWEPAPEDRGWLKCVPRRRCGDPLDIMVLMDAPAHVGCLIEVRIIGVIMAKQTEKAKQFYF
jgi:hypothetical protein